MSDLEALYRAVLVRPEEDTPRLAYADEVEERGDPERAELIRVQCELDRMKDRTEPISEALPRALMLGGRIVDLQQANRERWEPACVACGGTKEHAYQYPSRFRGETEPVKCQSCYGTGRQQCRWERGFPVVEVHALRQAWQLGKCQKCAGAGEIKYAVLEPPKFMWRDTKPEVATLETMWRAETRKCEACNSGAVWRPTLWLCNLLSTHHVAGVEVPGEYVLTRNNVPPRVWDRIDFRHHFGAQFGRAVVLAALEWLDAQPAPVPLSKECQNGS